MRFSLVPLVSKLGAVLMGSPLFLNLRSLDTSPSARPRLTAIWTGLRVPQMNGRRSAARRGAADDADREAADEAGVLRAEEVAGERGVGGDEGGGGGGGREVGWRAATETDSWVGRGRDGNGGGESGRSIGAILGEAPAETRRVVSRWRGGVTGGGLGAHLLLGGHDDAGCGWGLDARIA